MRFVVIGGDAAGMSAASRAKRNDPSLEVIVFEQTTDVSYSACGMPYNVADAGRDMDDLVVRKAETFRESQSIDVRLGHSVRSIDPQARTVSGSTSDGGTFRETYDKLLIATGARPVRLNIPGADADGVFALKSLRDGRSIKQYLADHPVRHALIIGMGYIGLEMAEALRSRGIDVTMAEVQPNLLPWLPDEMAGVALKELEDNSVSVRLGTRVEDIEPGSSGLSVNVGGEKLDAGMVLMAVGIAPNSEVAAEAGLKLGPGRSIAVDKALLTSGPDIYAAGDCSDAFHLVSGERVWIPLALRANRAGWAVGDNVTGRKTELPGVVGTAVFKVLGLEVARSGLSLAEAQSAGFEPVEAVIRSRTRAHSHPGNQTLRVQLVADKKTGRLIGGSMVGKEGAAHRIDALAVALHARMTVEDFFQCDMAYAPPFSPVWDPLLTAANQLLKRL